MSDKKGAEIAKTGERKLARTSKNVTIGALEQQLLKCFPKSDAESWDRTGLSVGERGLLVEKVAVALDPTVFAIEQARDIGANVLVTHHPLFLDAPTEFFPAPSVAEADGAGVFAAIRNKVAVMSFHTALDVNPLAARVLPTLLSLKYTGKLAAPLESDKTKGYGQICTTAKIDGRFPTLAQMAARALSVFGRTPRVWGDMEKPLRTVVTATGSASSLASNVLEVGADCLIAGEVRYHTALELSQAEIAIIEVGHDVSEIPLTAVLAEKVNKAGVPQKNIVVLDQSENWQYPEAVRL